MSRQLRAYAPAPLWWFAIPLLIAAVLLIIDQVTDSDRALTRFFYDPGIADFPWRRSFWLEVVMHQWVKGAVVTLACLTLGALVLSFVLPVFGKYRRTLLYLTLALALAPASVTAGKAASTRHCPWDIEEFGGLVPYATLFEPNPGNVKPGHCFPAGHASAGFALMAFYFAAYSRRLRRAARIGLAVGIGGGLILGFGRILQGAHFLSHVLWSGLLCWCVMLLLYLLLFRDTPAEAASPLPLAETAR